MTKQDLKDGMIVETRERGRYLLNNNRLLNTKGYDGLGVSNYKLEDVKDNLKDIECSAYDIVKVFKSHATHINKMFDSDNLKLIWNREDSEIKKGDKVNVINNSKVYEDYKQIFKKYYVECDYIIDYCRAGKPLIFNLYGECFNYEVLEVFEDEKVALIGYTHGTFLMKLEALKKVCD